MTLFAAPPGYILADGLAAALAERNRPALWLRLGPEDQDPASFLISLISAAQRLCPGVGAATLEQMRRRPGPIAGWPPLFTQLAHELFAAFPASGALVLERSHYLNHRHPTLELCSTYLLPALPASSVCILTADQRLPRTALPPQVIYREADDVRLTTRAALALAGRVGAGLSTACIDRIVALAEGRAGVVAGLCAASAALGPALIEQAARHATRAEVLLARIARAWMTRLDADARHALALAMRVEYSHPALIEAALGSGELPPGPWLQPLADGWARVRRMWQAPLQEALHAGPPLSRAILGRAADYMAAQDALAHAVALYFELHDPASAAQLIAGAASTLLDLGQWRTLSDWLSRLPRSALHAWPWLVYTSGELAAAQGQLDTARRAFAAATALFTARQDTDGIYQSILAESALAAWQGDRAYAQTGAQAVNAMAEAAGLAWHQGWAAWQLGCLAAPDDPETALAHFGRAAAAAAAAGNPLMADLIRQAAALTRHQHELRRQREFHRQEYLAAERAEHEAAGRLRGLLAAPPENLDALLEVHGWSRTPLMLKLPMPPAEPPAEPQHRRVWDTLLGVVGLRRGPPRPHTAAPALPNGVPPSAPALPTLDAGQRSPDQPPFTSSPAADGPPPDDPPAAGVLPPDGAGPVLDSTPAAPPELDAVAGTEPVGTVAPAVLRDTRSPLAMYCLGSFRAYQNDRLITDWNGLKGQAILKYLVAHQGTPIARDILMDVFWPDASPEAARRNLHQAIYSLRQTLKREQPDVQHIRFEGECYALNPELNIWLDYQEFERHIQSARQLERAGQIAEAMATYGIAAELYQGDFLKDDLYVDWPRWRREHLRNLYFEVIDRLSAYYLAQANYTAAIALCQKILAQDRCHEEAHRRLMQCYLAIGQRHAAVRQYQTCVAALQAELDLTPSEETMALYKQITTAA